MTASDYLVIGIGSTLATVALAAALYYLRAKIRRKKRRAAYPKDKVILHQFPRGLNAPSASPFVLKLETWLRIAGIPYQNDYGYEFSKKGQMPWITLNNEDIIDSQFCIEFLSKKFEIDLNKDLSVEQKAVTRALLKMTEESLKWQLVMRRYLFNPDPKEAGIPKYLVWLFKGKVKKAAWLQGYGRHSEEEVIQIARDDLKAINDYIGNKKFVMGDSICDLDATLFGFLAQFIYHDKGAINSFIKTECLNIPRYVETIKQAYWKDWDQCVRKKKN